MQEISCPICQKECNELYTISLKILDEIDILCGVYEPKFDEQQCCKRCFVKFSKLYKSWKDGQYVLK